MTLPPRSPDGDKDFRGGRKRVRGSDGVLIPSPCPKVFPIPRNPCFRRFPPLQKSIKENYKTIIWTLFQNKKQKRLQVIRTLRSHGNSSIQATHFNQFQNTNKKARITSSIQRQCEAKEKNWLYHENLQHNSSMWNNGKLSIQRSRTEITGTKPWRYDRPDNQLDSSLQSSANP